MIPEAAIADSGAAYPYGAKPPCPLKLWLWKPEATSAITVIVGMANFTIVTARLTWANNCTPNQLSATRIAMKTRPSRTPWVVSRPLWTSPGMYLPAYCMMASDALGGLVAYATQMPQPASDATSRPEV